jgi:dipeptidyl aminopeptidase/acylaminoacyl peptidase
MLRRLSKPIARLALWLVFLAAMVFESIRWLGIEVLPQTLTVLGTLSLMMARKDTTWRCIPYGALSGALGFEIALPLMGIVHPSVYVTPLVDLIWIVLPLYGTWWGAILGTLAWGCLFVVKVAARRASWWRHVPAWLALKYSFVVLALGAIAAEFCFHVPRTQWPARIISAHSGGVNSVAFDPHGERLASGGRDGALRLWNPTTGIELAALSANTESVTAVSFSPSGTQLASGGADGLVELWDTTDGRLLQTFVGHIDEITCLAFSPDGRYLASASGNVAGDGVVKLWLLSTGKEVARLTWGYSISALAFSPDGKTLLVATPGFPIVRIMEATSLSEIKTLRSSGCIWSAAFSPDGEYLATLEKAHDSGCNLGLWHTADWRRVSCLRKRSFLTAFVRSVAFSPDSTMLATGIQPDEVSLWSVESGQETAILRGHTYSPGSVSFSHDGVFLAAASSDGSITIWEFDAKGSGSPPDIQQ